MTSLVWFRRDLRVHDHPALHAALDADDDVLLAFCLDDRILHGRHASGPRTQFLLQSLRDLDGALRDRGAKLLVRHGRPERELRDLVEQAGVTAVHASRDLTPFARTRGTAVRDALAAAGAELHLHPGVTVVDDVGALATKAGRPYTVFSPFHRTWMGEGRRDVLDAPRTLPAPPARLATGAIPSLETLGLAQEVADPARGGETAARERLEAFLAEHVRDYGQGHDDLAGDRTSRLSPYLHLGCVSPREIEARLPRGHGPSAFRRQLCWRDFHHHVLLRFPQNARHEFQERYRDTLDWRDDDEAFDAWREGRTGYPLVDAGMRQLQREGWMHNRARLVVGSFLTKHLGIDWRRGEAHFMRLLLDGDEANNNGNWQWVASVGTDPQPAYRRLYNPARQMATHDPDGAYVRRYVPELARVPDEHLAEPWQMPDEVQRAAGCVIGEDYPAPIVDHAAARREALDRYAVA